MNIFSTEKTEKSDQLSKKIYTEEFSFPFTIEDLNLSYTNRNLTVRATVSNIKNKLSQEQCYEKITYHFKALFNYFLNDNDFHYSYNKVLFIETANKNKLKLISNFNSFLYKFPFIKTCSIGYYFLEPILSNINNIGLHTVITNNERDELCSLLIATNLKENDFLKFINDLRDCPELAVNRTSVTSRDCADSVKGTIYNRIEYEKGLNK